MIRKIGYFWSFILTWVLFGLLELAGLFFFGIDPISLEARMIAAFVIVWATAKDNEVRSAK